MSGVANNVQGSTIFSDNTVTGGPNDVVVRDLVIQNDFTIEKTLIAKSIVVEDAVFTDDIQLDGNIALTGNVVADGYVQADSGLISTGDNFLNGNVLVDEELAATDISAVNTVTIGELPAPVPGTEEVFTCYGDAAISGTLTVNGAEVSGPGGTINGAVQLKSAGGGFDAYDEFYIETSPNKRLRITDPTPSTSATTGSFVNDGGIGCYNLYTGHQIHALGTANATSTTTGALQTLGGIGAAKAIYAGGKITTTDNTASSSVSTGAIVASGGIGTNGNINASGVIKTINNGVSSNTTTGAIVAGGGIGCGGAVNAGGAIKTTDTTASSSTSTGSIIAEGGIGCAGAINAGGSIATSGGAVITTDCKIGPYPAVQSTRLVVGQNTKDTAVNGTTSGTSYNMLQLTDPIRSWIYGTDGTNGTEFYFGVTGGVPEDPDFKWYYDTAGRFALLGNPVGTITAPTSALFTVRGTSLFENTTASTSTTTGCVVANGGVGIAGQLNVGGAINQFTGNTASTSTTTGTLVVVGGVGVQGTINAGIVTGNAGIATHATQAGMKIQHFSGNPTSGNITWTFPSGYLAAPKVIATAFLSGEANMRPCHITALSNSAVTVRCVKTDNSACENTTVINMIAIGNAL